MLNKPSVSSRRRWFAVVAGAALVLAFAGGVFAGIMPITTSYQATNAPCASIAGDIRTDIVALSTNPATPTLVTQASLNHACTGDLVVDFTGVTFTSNSNTSVAIRAVAQCTGGGCTPGTTIAQPNTGGTIPGWVAIDSDVDQNLFGIQESDANGFLFAFVELPRGRYTIRIEGISAGFFGNAPAGAGSISTRHMVASTYGPYIAPPGP